MRKPKAAGPETATGLRQFMLRPAERRESLIMLGVFVVLYILIAYCYPYPIHCLTDASAYISVAINHLRINYRPYGYSAFLNMVHGVNGSMWFLFFAQYVLYAVSLFLFIQTIKWMFDLERWMARVLALVVIVSPVSLYFTNYALSDSLFASLSVLWVTTGIWIIRYKSIRVIIPHLIFMVMAIHVRYAGLIYPIITAVLLVITLNDRSMIKRVGIALLQLQLLTLYYMVTVHYVKKETGIEIFSGFSGWSMANNAVSVIPHVRVDANAISDPEVRVAHAIIKQFPDSVYVYDTRTTTKFIWNNKWPGKGLLSYVLQNNPKTPYFQGWVYTGKIWGKYGAFLIRKYPVEFIQYFAWPNLKEIFYPDHIYLPPCREDVSPLLKTWYGTSLASFDYNFDPIAKIDGLLRVLNLLWWLLLMAAFAGFIAWYKHLPLNINQKHFLIFGFMAVALYAGFVVISHPFEQRYIINIHVLKVTASIIMIHGWLLLRKKTRAKN